MYKPWIPVFVINLLITAVVCLIGYPPRWYFVCIMFSVVPLVVELTYFLWSKQRRQQRELLEEKRRRLAVEQALERAQRGILQQREMSEQLKAEQQQRQAERAAMDLVYFIVNREAKTVKIGVSIDPKSRLGQLQTSTPHQLELAATSPGGYSLEGQLHVQFAAHRLKGEWFRLVPEIQQQIDIANGQAGRRSRSKTC